MAVDPEKPENDQDIDNEASSDVTAPVDSSKDKVLLEKMTADWEATSLDVEALVDADVNELGESTSLDVEALIEEASAAKGKQSPETKGFSDTGEFAFDSFEEGESNEPAQEKQKDIFHRPASILDLIKGTDNSVPVVAYEEDDNLDKRLEGKSLEDVLRITQKHKDGWHESERAKKSDEEKAILTKKRQRKLWFATPFIILFSGVICFYIILPTFNPPAETDKIRLPKRRRKTITPEKLKIDPALKDSAKLEKYYKMGEDLYKKKKYDKAEIVFRKLLPTGWRSGEILAWIGECRDNQKDRKGAVEYYIKALKGGYESDIKIPLRLATLLKEEKRYREILDAVAPLQEKFATNIQLQSLLAEIYWELEMPVETLVAFRKINKQFLSEKQLQVFADLLMKENDEKEAFNVYLFLSQNFNNIPSFMKAADLAPTPKMRIAVLSELTGKTLGTAKWNYYNMLLGEAFLSQGLKKEALRVLESINPEKLSGDNALRFLKMIANFENSESLFEACEKILIKKYKNNLSVQEEIRDLLIANDKSQLVKKLFYAQVAQFPKSSIANYMFATVVTSTGMKYKYLEKTLDLNPDFYVAVLALGHLYCADCKWDDALKKFKKCFRLNSSAKAPRYWTAIALIRLSDDDALPGYQKFLEKTGTSEANILTQMIRLAQYLPDDTMAMKYLKEMQKFPRLKNYMKLQIARTKLIYGKAEAGDFKDKSIKGMKKYRVIFLLGEGKLSEVMMLPTLKSEFPEFWKVFICWRKNISSWRENSRLLIVRNPDDPFLLLASKLWRREISPADAGKQVEILDYEQRPLLYFMIAERYRKDNNKVKSSIAYLTAMRYKPPNLYTGIIKYFKK